MSKETAYILENLEESIESPNTEVKYWIDELKKDLDKG